LKLQQEVNQLTAIVEALPEIET